MHRKVQLDMCIVLLYMQGQPPHAIKSPSILLASWCLSLALKPVIMAIHKKTIHVSYRLEGCCHNSEEEADSHQQGRSDSNCAMLYLG